MKKSVLIAALIFLSSLSKLQPCYAGVEWTLKKQLDMEAAPLDIALSPDGQWMFVLTSGEYTALTLFQCTRDNRSPK